MRNSVLNLNTAQKRHLHVTLYSFEKALRESDRLLEEGNARGILFIRELNLSESQRQLARKKIAHTLGALEAFVQQLGLEPKVEDPSRVIMAEMSVCWTHLEDCRPKGLRNYGELTAEDADQIDPIITKLASMAIELTRLFPTGPDDSSSE
jgi:hypothetical protein